MTQTVIFETHSTSVDNEAGLASGYADVPLSPQGESQAVELGVRRRHERLDAVYCSDLQRSYRTAELAFGAHFPILRDRRLRECDYGELTRRPVAEVQAVRAAHLTQPFPGGESYGQATDRVRRFLEALEQDRAKRRVLIIGHRATQYSLEHLLRGVALAVAVSSPWQWEPGWRYEVMPAGE